MNFDDKEKVLISLSGGVDSALGSLKKMSRDSNKSVWLVSHKDELAGRVNNILKVLKENGTYCFLASHSAQIFAR